MKKLTFLLMACLMAVFTYGQDGVVYWSYEDGYKFDFNLDGKVDLSVPTQTKDLVISEVFVYDANGDGFFDLCEIDRSCSVDQLIHWRFYYNDGNNNFVDPQDAIYGMAVGDKSLSGDFNNDGVGDVAIRRDNEHGLWWLMHFFQEKTPDVNLAFGISDADYLLAGDMNNDGQDDVVLYDKGAWLCSFTPSTTELKTPDFAVQDIANMQFGTKNDIPLLFDCDGDGYDDMGICSLNDEEVSVNLHQAGKTENHGYSKSGRGSFDKTFYMPAGVKATCVRGVRLKEGANINTTGSNSLVSVFPSVIGNTGSFTVETDDSDIQISVYNVMGQLVKSVVTTNGSDSVIRAEGWNSGNYYVRIEAGGAVVTKKLLVL